MTKREVFEWLSLQDCEVNAREGINNSVPHIMVHNRKTNAYSYFVLLPHDNQVPRISINKLIKDLGIEPPKNY